VDAYESSLGPGGEDGHEGHPENSEKAAENAAEKDAEKSAETVAQGGESPSESNSGEQIMGGLPRSRPKRQTPRSKSARTRTGGAPKAPRAKAGARRQATGSAARPRSRSRTAASTKAATSPGRERSDRDPAVFGASEHAPGLPRLALDGAIEAAKLPIKVGANITLRALDAVAKSLRGR
jgi:hypothetical protein